MSYQFPKNNYMPAYIRFTPLIGDAKSPLLSSTIELPLPPGVVFSDQMVYENTDFGALATSFIDNGLLQTGKNVLSTVGLAVQDEDVAKSVSTNVTKKFGVDIGRARNRMTPNPNTRALFKQVNLRTFQLTYKLIPDSNEEAEEIESIIDEFRLHMYPTAVGETIGGFAGGEGLKLGFKFPNMFKIQIFINDKEMKQRKIQPCFLVAMNTTYNSSSGAIMARKGKEAHFSETDLSMTFQEEVALDKLKVLEGY